MFRILLLLFLMTAFANAIPTSNVEKELLAATEAWKQAMLARDRAELEQIFAPELTYTHSNGRNENKAEAIEAVVNGKDRITSLELSGTTVSIYGKTAVVKAKVLMRMNTDTGVNVLNLDVLFVWVKTGPKWQMVARHALRLTP